MKKYRNVNTGEEVKLHTKKAIERFFENRNPNDWEEVND